MRIRFILSLSQLDSICSLLSLSIGKAYVNNLVAKGVYLVGKHKEVKSVLSEFVFGDDIERLVELEILHFALLLLCVRAVEHLLLIGDVVVEFLAHVGGVVHVALQIGGRGQFEDVGVEGGHFGLHVVEQVRLLHVTALHLHRDFFEEFLNLQVFLNYVALLHNGLSLPVHLVKRGEADVGKAVRVEGVQTEVGLGGVVCDKH